MSNRKRNAIILRMEDEGISRKDIAAALSLTTPAVNAVINRARKGGKTCRAMDTSWHQTARCLYASGLSRREVAERLNRPRSTVDGVLRERAHTSEARPVMQFLRERFASVPDTRDLTGRLLGDPLPHRSALAQRAEGRAAL